MVATTFIHDSELDQPTGDSELDSLLTEVNHRTGKNFQVVISNYTYRSRWFRQLKVGRRIQLYCHVGGMAPWQVIGVASGSRGVRAYLMGLLSGLDVSDLQRLEGQ